MTNNKKLRSLKDKGSTNVDEDEIVCFKSSGSN